MLVTTQMQTRLTSSHKVQPQAGSRASRGPFSPLENSSGLRGQHVRCHVTALFRCPQGHKKLDEQAGGKRSEEASPYPLKEAFCPVKQLSGDHGGGVGGCHV